MTNKVNILLRALLYMIIFVTPLTIGGANILSGLLFITWIISLMIKKDFSFFDDRFNKVIGLAIIYILASTIWAYNFNNVISEFIGHFLPFITIYFVIIEVIDNKRQINIILGLFFVSTTFVSFYSLLLARNQGRVQAFTHSPNRLADILMMLIILSFSYLLFDTRSKYKKYGLVGFILGSMGLLTTMSRGGWVATFAALFVILLIKSKKYLLFFLIILVLLPIFMPNIIIERGKSIFDLNKHTNKERILMWKSAFNMFRDHPILGIGYNNIRNRYSEYMQEEATETHHMQLHNLYLNVLAELGLIGFGILCYLVYGIIKIAISLFQIKKLPIIVGFIGIMIGVLVHGIFDVTIRATEVGLLFSYFPALIYLINKKKLAFEMGI